MSDYAIHHGDCLTVMPTLEAGSVDAIICDPPYGTSLCKWDAVIPFDLMWAHIKRLIKPSAPVVLFGSQPFTSALIMSNPKWFRYEWIWEKSRITGFLDVNRKPRAAHENVLVFCASAAPYHPQKWQADPLFMDRRKTFSESPNNSQGYGAHYKRKSRDDGSRYPLSIISIASNWAAGMHPTQKPVALMEYLIRTYTNEGDTVLDFTAGSFTTGVACLNTERRFIGIERDANYFAIGQERLAKAASSARQLELEAVS